MQFLKDEEIEKMVAFFPNNELRLDLHSSGMLDVTQWNPAFVKKYGEEDWEIKGGMALSKYALKVYEVHAEYFWIVVEDGKNKVSKVVMECEIGEFEIKKLRALRVYFVDVDGGVVCIHIHMMTAKNLLLYKAKLINEALWSDECSAFLDTRSLRLRRSSDCLGKSR